MKTIVVRLLSPLCVSASLLLGACSTAPTHPALTGNNAQNTSASTGNAPVELPPLVPARMYVADWDGNGGYQISPDGKQLMWGARKGLNQGLFVKNLETGVVHSYNIPALGRWAQDSRHILLELHNGNENASVFSLDSFQEQADRKNLTPFAGARSTVQSTIEGSDDVLIISNQRDAKVFDLYRWRANNGQLDMVAQNPGNVALWLTDRLGNLVGRGSKEGTKWVYEASDTQVGATQWKKAFEVSVDDTIIPLEVSAARQSAWALSNRGRDKIALVEVDLKTGTETVFYQDPRADLEYAWISHQTGQPLAATLQPGMQEWKIFDPRMQKLATQLTGPRTREMHVLSISKDENMLTTLVLDDNGGRSLLVNAQTQTATVLGELGTSRINAISPLPQRTAIGFNSRDGLALHGYLTLPQDSHGNTLKHLPTVLVVHGGPWARDYWASYNMPLFLANRGYAVLQVNYRGSTGYGKAFADAAKGEFAGKMHTDLLDGLDWLVGQGIADPARVAIMGGSYGGYASLVGMTHTPGTFACGISLFGISDLPSLISDFPPYWELDKQKWYDFAGDPARPEDLQRMRDQSPLYRADKVQGPLLILQGALDVRVHQDQSSRMVEALQKAGKPVEYVMFPKAGHGLHRWPDNLTFYRKTEDFLAQCLGGRSAGFDFFELGKLIF